jgi:hypothetical protein
MKSKLAKRLGLTLIMAAVSGLLPATPGLAAPHPHTWSSATSMTTRRGGLAAASTNCSLPPPVFRSCVYAIGGQDGSGQVLASMEAYDPLQKTWTQMPPMPTARSFLAAATGRCPTGLPQPFQCIFAFGGFDGTRVLSTVEVYNPGTNSWTEAPPMPTARASLAAVDGPDGQIYVIGGGTGAGASAAGTVEAFDPSSNPNSRAAFGSPTRVTASSAS